MIHFVKRVVTSVSRALKQPGVAAPRSGYAARPCNLAPTLSLRVSVLVPVLVAVLAGVLLAPAAALAQEPTQWSRRISGPAARICPGMTFDSVRNVTVMFGGDVAGGYSNETWEWNGVVWRRPNPSPAPSARGRGVLSFDSARGVTVLFGGSNGPSTQDTWEWNGTTWRPCLVFGAKPSPRIYHAMAYDAIRGKTILFGGLVQGANSSETWEWNGTTWNQLAVTGPSARNGHQMVYDGHRGVIVMFGGTDYATGVPNNELWEWNGATWTQRTIGLRELTPSPRTRHILSYDAMRRKVVLYGGRIGSGAESRQDGEAWEWDGVTGGWQQRFDPSPAARSDFAAVFDSSKSTTFIFGGSTPYGATGETWGLGAPCVTPQVVFQDYSRTICPGSDTMLRISAIGSGPLSYQWRKGGVFISATQNPSANSPSLMLQNVSEADGGFYDCLIANGCDTVASTPARVTPRSPADIGGGGPDGQQPDGFVDGNDFIAFINAFTAGC